MSHFLIIYKQVEEAAREKSQQKRTNVDKGELSEMFGTVEKDPKPRREGSAPITRGAVMKEDALDGDIDDDDADTDDGDTDDKVDEAEMKNIMWVKLTSIIILSHRFYAHLNYPKERKFLLEYKLQLKLI